MQLNDKHTECKFSSPPRRASAAAWVQISRSFPLFAGTPAVRVHVTEQEKQLQAPPPASCLLLLWIAMSAAVVVIIVIICDDLLPCLQDAVSFRSFSAAFDQSQEDGFDIVCVPLAHCKVLIPLIAGGFQFKSFINIPS